MCNFAAQFGLLYLTPSPCEEISGFSTADIAAASYMYICYTKRKGLW